MKKLILILAILILSTFFLGCEIDTEKLMEAMVKSAKEQKKAEWYGWLARCPDDAPYRIGGLWGGTCTDKEGLSEYVSIRLRGTEPEAEKRLILAQRALLEGRENMCPKSLPYYTGRVGPDACVSREEFYEHFIGEDVEAWEKEEEKAGKTRFLTDTSYCKAGFAYDTHLHLCVGMDCGANARFDLATGDCKCDKGYTMTGDGCLKAESCKEGYRLTLNGCEKEPSNKQCVYDSDCKSKGTYCSSSAIMVRYVCNARTYRCDPQRVECGEGYKCDSLAKECVKK
jgi:hypothetical protein